MEQAKGGGWCNIGRNDGGWHKAGGGGDVEKWIDIIAVEEIEWAGLRVALNLGREGGRLWISNGLWNFVLIS